MLMHFTGSTLSNFLFSLIPVLLIFFFFFGHLKHCFPFQEQCFQLSLVRNVYPEEKIPKYDVQNTQAHATDIEVRRSV